MTKIIVLEKRVDYEPGDVLAAFDPETFSEEKLREYFKNSTAASDELFTQNTSYDEDIKELYREGGVETWFGSYAWHLKDVL